MLETKVHPKVAERAPTRALSLSTYRGLGYVKHSSVLNVKALVLGTFNQEKALVGAFSVIVPLHQLIDLRH